MENLNVVVITSPSPEFTYKNFHVTSSRFFVVPNSRDIFLIKRCILIIIINEKLHFSMFSSP